MSVEIARTDRLILRRWRESDREPFAALNADPRVMEFLPRRLSVDESNAMIDRLESDFNQQGFGVCAVETIREGSFIGCIGLGIPGFSAHFTPCVEIAWRLGADFWGYGLATEGAREIVRLAFGSYGLQALVSFTVPANRRSRRVMEKLGMTYDPSDDFDHPELTPNDWLRRHVLYRLQKQPIGL